MADSSRGIDLDSMSLDQLDQVKQQEENRLNALTSRYSQLRQAAVRLQASHSAVLELKSSLDGNQVMVPLTESLYVPGKIVDPTTLLVEIGTGFYVEKSTKDTSEFLQRKLAIVDANSDNITTVIQGTQQNISSVNMAMQGKMMEIRARQEGRLYQQNAAAAAAM
jgi:prefoldin alpha subunit